MKLIAALTGRTGSQSSSTKVLSAMDFTQAQKDALQKARNHFGKKLPEALSSDFELYKFLKARNFNVEKAIGMLEKSIAWRSEWNIDALLSWDPPEVLKKYNPAGMTGFDKEGSPVWIIPFGNCDLRGLLHSCSDTAYIRYQLYVLENSLDLLRKKYYETKRIHKQICIFDMENFSIRTITWKPARDTLLQLVQMYEGNYPELLKCCYVVNAPLVFSTAMAIVKPFLYQDTLDKIKIFGTSGWKDELLKEISADQLPVHWGGTQTDPDGNTKCLSKVCPGGEVPKRYYLKNKSQGSPDNMAAKTANMKSLILPNGGKEAINVKIEQPASTLKWEFFTENFDVGFAISRLLSSGVEEVLLAPTRVNCQLVPEEGTLYCIDTGTYEVTFDNEHSYLRSKKLFYKIEVIPPSDTTKF